MRVITRQRNTSNANSPREEKKAKKGLSSRKVNDYLRFSFFLVLIGVAYIWNSYEAERKVKMMEDYRKEVKRLKAEYLLRQSTLSAGTRFSEIKDQIDTLGLRPLREPAYKLVKGLEVPMERLNRPDLEELRLMPEDSVGKTGLAINQRQGKARP
ncbi:MAG: hypothetical protein MRZ79_26595 [Bacteroidia bacterium]|nr:hypothetical protein [Bacteroidia bacterium]